eukprot:Blabericola_migrator_1__11618@NODE_698_length_6826_cov_185_661340_g507_i0_p2_GENE_NODE_698_length_6826_cov_185_661340_g507_i0NODE_698_length_6826_cov_185_661340_g507_i0_p2_ORF_typecomplete_len387_score54_93Hydrolase_4/PF12146_8/1_4e25Abhydrolase_6/PF12697_7/5_9e11Abhydrolase_1/PF00561_20/2_9e11DUF1100/PF06500_11/2_6e06Peptidase_S9/PF00326_21/0_012DUF676/PF05057_14/0_0027DLH/PF01738_18/0_018Peptidase_S15/PF02129_18/0_0074LIDHydrolase/PF10230_9/0_0096Thioesterase/PF00975_20/0_038DUF726/PF05277_12/
MGRDLPFDGDPLDGTFESPGVLGEKVWYCKWPKASTADLRGVWILLHGLRGFSRYSWLLKEPRLTDGVAVLNMSEVVPGLETGLPPKATEDDRDIEPFYKGSWVHALNHLGYDVHAMDLRGHGLSDGRRGDFDGVDTHVKDVTHYIWNVVSPLYEEEIPLYAAGVSLGGNILIRCLHQATERRRFKAVVLLGAMATTPADGSSWVPRIGALLNEYVISKLLPALPVSPMGDAVTEANVGFLQHCPLVVTQPLSAKTVQKLIEAARALEEAVKANCADNSVQWCADHVLIVHNATDPTCPIPGCIRIWNKIIEAKVAPKIDIAILNRDELPPSSEAALTEETRKHLVECGNDLDLRHPLMCDVDHASVFKLIIETLNIN